MSEELQKYGPDIPEDDSKRMSFLINVSTSCDSCGGFLQRYLMGISWVISLLRLTETHSLQPYSCKGNKHWWVELGKSFWGLCNMLCSPTLAEEPSFKIQKGTGRERRGFPDTQRLFSPLCNPQSMHVLYPTGLYMNYFLLRKSVPSIRISWLWYKHRKPHRAETAGCLPNCEMSFLIGMIILKNSSKKVSVYLGWCASYFSNLNSMAKGKSLDYSQVRAPSLLSKWHHLAWSLSEEDGNQLSLDFVLRTHISVRVNPGCPGHFLKAHF